MDLKRMLVGLSAMAGVLCYSGDAFAISSVAHKITVSGGVLIDEPKGTTTKGGLHQGDVVEVLIDTSKNGNGANSFAYWTYTPATADLGEGFNQFMSYVEVTMPNADVKLTANFVNGFAACLKMDYVTVGEAPAGDFYWSVDGGKTLIPFGRDFPVKAGKVKAKFYDKTGNWRASDMEVSVDKRGTYREDGVTYYDDPWKISRVAKFVPVDNSTKVKLDLNGGTGSGEALLANGYEYGSMGIPFRKGYVFAGWWTAKDGGSHIVSNNVFSVADFAGQRTPTLYAHWLQLRKLTLKDDFAYAYWDFDEVDIDPELLDEVLESFGNMNPGFDGYGELEGKGVLEVLPGACVNVWTDGDVIYDRYDNELTFQKWTVTPSKANLGPDFRVTQYDTSFTMPNEDVTFQATYIDESTCGWLRATAYADAIDLGWDDELEDWLIIEPPFDAFEWSPDGGKTWYKAGAESWDSQDEESGESAMLKAGTYTVTWRSTDPCWAAMTGKRKTLVQAGMTSTDFTEFTYVPQVVVDVMTFEDGECIESAVGGTVTMNPKDGLVPMGKTIALTAKAAKNYAFQGWAFGKDWQYGARWDETAATWKLASYLVETASGGYISSDTSWLREHIDPFDLKVHVVAVFKAIADYSADDIVFEGFDWYDTYSFEATYDDGGNASVTIKAVVGCALGYGSYGYELKCGAESYPLAYKLAGKLPDGLKFDAKTGVLSGAPKKAGKSSVTITAADPAKNAKGIVVNFDIAPLPTWLVGEYRGMMTNSSGIYGEWLRDEETAEEYQLVTEGPKNGLLELSVKSDGKVSAKILTKLGTASLSGTLMWMPGEEDESEGLFALELSSYSSNSGNSCYVEFSQDGMIEGYAYSAVTTDGAGGFVTGMRQDVELLAVSPFLDKYYTFAFFATATNSEDSYWDEELGDYVTDEKQSGYGYLTLKTDKKGVAKVAGQLPDGEKVSMSALVLPFMTDDYEHNARLCVFASPSSYKKEDWFAMSMVMREDGSIETEDGANWTPALSLFQDDDDYDDYGYYYPYDISTTVTGEGALYSEAKSLEGYYWTASCEYNEDVKQQYSYKDGSYTYCDYAYAYDIYDYFEVSVKGDAKGAISLVEKSPAPWVEKGAWNVWEDKKGNEITDPSQLSISFTKATGIFTGKASVYFAEPRPTSASLPYAGVMIYDGAGGYDGFGSAVHTYKYSYSDDYGRTKTDTKKVTLPVLLEPADAPAGE